MKSFPLSRDAVKEREEIEQQVEEFPSRLGESPVGAVTSKAGTLLNGHSPIELFRICNVRKRVVFQCDDGAVIELCEDEVEIEPPSRKRSASMRFSEIELELKEGSADRFHQLVALLESHEDLLPSRMTKFQRGLSAIGIWRPTLPDDARPLLNPDDPAILLAHRCLQDRWREVLIHEDAAWEGLDPEGVHQMRVATRRIRAAFRIFRKVLPETAVHSFKEELKWLAGVLGEVRDLDVHLQALGRYARHIPGCDAHVLEDHRTELGKQWHRARQNLIECLGSNRYAELKQRFGEFIESGVSQELLDETGEYTVCVAGRKLIHAELKRILEHGGRITKKSPPECYHNLRIRCKRLRYAYEFFQPVYGKRVRSLIAGMKKFQDVLGQHQDACVAVERVRNVCERVPLRKNSKPLLLVFGQLINAKEHEAAKRRRQFRRLWKDLDSKSLLRQHAKMYRSAGPRE